LFRQKSRRICFRPNQKSTVTPANTNILCCPSEEENARLQLIIFDMAAEKKETFFSPARTFLLPSVNFKPLLKSS
jgi:hypothetical protein